MKKQPTVAKVASVTVASSEDLKKISAWLNRIGEPEEDHHHIILDKCRRDPEAHFYYFDRATGYEREKRWQKVLVILAECPDKKSVYTTDTTTDQDNVTLTIANFGVAAFEILIPKAKYDPFLFIEVLTSICNANVQPSIAVKFYKASGVVGSDVNGTPVSTN